MNGRLIVIEGADGAGCEEQSCRLFNLLKSQNEAVVRIRYPDYSGPIGRVIHDYLHGRNEFSPQALFLLYTADMMKDTSRIKGWLRQGRTVILDRYITSAFAYQAVQGIELDSMLRFAEMFSFPKPDSIVYLRVDPDVSIRRKFREKEALDRNENDKDFIKSVLGSYERLISAGVFGEWSAVDANASAEEVFASVRKALRV